MCQLISDGMHDAVRIHRMQPPLNRTIWARAYARITAAEIAFFSESNFTANKTEKAEYLTSTYQTIYISISGAD